MNKILIFVVMALIGASSVFGQQKLVKQVDTIADLKNQNVNDIHKSIEVLGLSTRGDGLGGLYYWDSGSVFSPDDANYVQANSTASGRWVRVGVKISGGYIPITDHDRWRDLPSIKDFGAESGENIDDAIDRITAALPGDSVVRVPRGTYYIDTVTLSKRIRFVGEPGAVFVHEAAATGSMFVGTTEQRGVFMDGITLDGNKANQSLASFYGILDGEFDNAIIQNCVFTNVMDFAIRAWSGSGDLLIQHCEFWDQYQLLATAEDSNGAIIWAPGEAGTRTMLTVKYCKFNNNDGVQETSRRLPGGVFTSGSWANDSWVYPQVLYCYFNGVGDDDAVGAAHWGIAAIDFYNNNISGLALYNVITNSQYIGIKGQNTENLIVSGNDVHTTGTIGIQVDPSERENPDAEWGATVENNKVTGDPTRTVGVHLTAGDAGGWHKTLIRNNTLTNINRGIILEGVDENDVVTGYGPVRIEGNDVHSIGHNAFQMYGTVGARIDIVGNSFQATNGGSAMILIQTNSATDVTLFNNDIKVWGAGWGFRAWGLRTIDAAMNTIEIDGVGESVELKQDALGNLITNLFWERNNRIISGAVDITAADIVQGYFGNGANVTWYPSGAVEATTGTAGSYLKHLFLDQASASPLFRISNDDAAGAALINLRAGGPADVVGQISAYASGYSDADRAGWQLWRAENAVGTLGISIEAPYASKQLRLRAGDSTTRVSVDGNGLRFPTLTANRLAALGAQGHLTNSIYSEADLTSMVASDNIQVDGVDADDANFTSSTFDITLSLNAGTAPDTVGVGFARSAAIGTDPAMSASAATFGSLGIVFEGLTANGFEGLLNSDDVTADRTWTLPNESGTLALSSSVDPVLIDGNPVVDSAGVDFQTQPMDLTITFSDGVSPDSAVLSFSRLSSLASNPTLSANTITIGATGVLFEGTAQDSNEGLLTAGAISADTTWTLPDESGTLALAFTTGLGITNIANVISNNIVAGTGMTITAGANGQLTLASSAADGSGRTTYPVVTTTDATLTPIYTNTLANNSTVVIFGTLQAINSGSTFGATKEVVATFQNIGGTVTQLGLTYVSEHYDGTNNDQWVSSVTIAGANVVFNVQNNEGSGTVRWVFKARSDSFTY